MMNAPTPCTISNPDDSRADGRPGPYVYASPALGVTARICRSAGPGKSAGGPAGGGRRLLTVSGKGSTLASWMSMLWSWVLALLVWRLPGRSDGLVLISSWLTRPIRWPRPGGNVMTIFG